jgi:SAM-dependent methyltransferase
MTDEQLEIANRNIAPIMENIGYATPNIEFRKGRIEQIPVDTGTVDVVISNCVINLSTHKEQVFKEIWRVLKPGGEFYISDIIADRRIPTRLADDERLYSECLTGAAYEGDLHRIMREAGFMDVRYGSKRLLGDVIEGIHFFAANVRGFKVDLEDECEDYGQVAVYKGTIPGKETEFALDLGHVFTAGSPMRVCKNSADMLAQSRYAPHFTISDEMFHMGLFDCSPAPTAPQEEASPSGCC